MSDTPASIAVTTQYLNRLERALHLVPQNERSAIITEISGHIAERSLKPNVSIPEILKDLGEPHDLARAYVEQYMLTDALQRSTPGPLLLAILDRATRSSIAFSIGLGGVISYTFALSFTAIAILKPILPQNVGLWWGERASNFGFFSSPPEHTSELLGLWITPISLVAAVLCYSAGTALIKWGGRVLLRKAAVFPTS